MSLRENFPEKRKDEKKAKFLSELVTIYKWSM